jgi:hypothetical protein
MLNKEQGEDGLVVYSLGMCDIARSWIYPLMESKAGEIF